MKKEDSLKPYDAKKSVWVPDGEGGYDEALIQEVDGDKITVKVGWEPKVFKADQCHQINPPKLEKCDDVSNMTYLNDASVLWNLKSRYVAKLIYTYSGLFCVVINPYKRYPLYTNRVVAIYIGKRRNEVSPHLFAISDGAYQQMMNNSRDQSMLITGESGAGKTENTKKVITYFAILGQGDPKKKDPNEEKKANLEDRIVNTNPILESYGNAKTIRNDNSSRFGKFIRIYFNHMGKLAGGFIDVYLLEKSRVTYQQANERCYHIFFQLLEDGPVPGLKEKCCLSDDVYDYFFCSQGKVRVDSIDDNEELEFTDLAFDTLGFDEEEKYNAFKMTATVLHIGEMTFKQKGREEACEMDDIKPGQNVCTLCGIENWQLFYGNFIRPKIKVGTEWVYKGQNANQCLNSCAALARSLYNRLFLWLVDICNRTLVDPTMKKVNFIGVLDIAGFEIFEFNTFEQICINFCNEKLQQFFNHHMFVLEQEEYVREGIEWVMVDFGMDLEATIVLFEKPMGLMAILEEETMFPKASDKSFEEKLKENLLGKSPVFLKKQPGSKDKNAHFSIAHYAGTVNYNITNWLDKNKDSINDTVIDQMKKSDNPLVCYLFREHPGQPEEAPSKEKKKGKDAGPKVFKTVSSFFRSQLDALLTTLNSTDPHFIRCIIPNNHKTPGLLDSALVMHQLTCNGVLEGIRICRRGFPNRTIYFDFRYRFIIIKPKEVYQCKDDHKEAARVILESCEDMNDKWRLGHTKVFFRAGSIGILEEVRDESIKKIINVLQGIGRGYVKRKEYKIEISKRNFIPVMQRNFKKFMFFRDWSWYYLTNHTKRFIGQVNIEDEIAAITAEAAEACSQYDAEVIDRDRFLEGNKDMVQEKKDMMEQIQAEQGDLSSYQKELAEATAGKQAKDDELAKITKKLNEAEVKRNDMNDKKRKYEGDLGSFRKDIDDMEMAISRAEQEKTNRDHTIRNMNDEIAHQDELINKLNKEKKYMQENQAKSSEELGSAEEKLDHLSKIKVKLEVTLDELEDSLEREKKARLDMDKQRRKIEAELKVTQEQVTDLEKGKKDIEGNIAKKDKDIGDAQHKLDDEQNLVGKLQKSIKELQSRIEANEEELEAERQARSKAEKQRGTLARELDNLGERLEEAGGATSAQVELNKKREAEIGKLRRDLEESVIQHESILAGLKKKHLDAIAEMSEQIDQLNKMKQKIEKEKHGKRLQIDELVGGMDTLANEKASTEKQNRLITQQLADVTRRGEEANLTLSDFDNAKKKIILENADLLHSCEELDNNNSVLAKLRQTLTAQLEEQRKIADDEAKERTFLLGKFRNMEHEVEAVREQLEEEAQGKGDALRMLSKSVNEAQMWRCKYEKDGLARSEELESAKMKLQSRLAEAEATIENLNGKAMCLEKEKMHVQAQIEETAGKVDDAQARCFQMEKKAKNFDKVVIEWKNKIDALQGELDQTQVECRSYSTELFKVKTVYEESQQQLETVRRENKNLSSEIKDIMDQIGEGGRTIHEIDKIRKRLENEKLELQAALEEAEGALEQEENKVLRSQLELSQVKQEIERRIKEKEEEFESIRKTHQKAVESMQSSLENETRAKGEAIRMKKKLEADINELDIALEHANGSNAEAQKTIKRYQQQIKEAQLSLESEQIGRDRARENLIQSERRAHAVQNELEETKTQLEHADRQRRAAEQEMSDAVEQLSDATLANQSLQSSKRKLDSEMQTMHADLDEMLGETKLAEEKAKKAMMDAARLADELRSEQDQAQHAEKSRRALEYQVKDMHNNLDEAEQLAMRGGKKVTVRLDQKIKDLETQLDDETRRLVDAQKAQRRTERRIKELTFSQSEDHKNHERMQDLVDKLQNKVKTYKKQIEEAEEIAALNLAKFRQVQGDLEQAEERADINEQVVAKYRAKGRAESVGL
jgi:myosin heavy chain 6/7